jgi:hypothetical protein
MTTLYFDSRKNYLKRDPVSTSTTMLGPVTNLYGGLYSGYLYIRDLVIPHSVGSLPVYRVYYEPFGDGTIYPAKTWPLDQRAINILPTGTSTGPGLIYFATATSLTIRLFYENASLAANSYPIHYVIYKDVQLT